MKPLTLILVFSLSLVCILSIAVVVKTAKINLKYGQCASLPAHTISEGEFRIVNGIPVSENKYPFIGALFFKDKFLCSCCLIHPNFAIGAAHCVSYLDLYIVFGITVINDINGIKREIKNIFANPNFSTISFKNDICLFELKEPVISIKPACLPYNEEEISSRFILAGWGKTETESYGTLMETTLLKSQDCLQYDLKTQICASNKEINSGPCLGDSGSPLLYLNKSNIYIVCGIVSRGSNICGSSSSIFTKVYPYLSWISKHLTI